LLICNNFYVDFCPYNSWWPLVVLCSKVFKQGIICLGFPWEKMSWL